MADPGLRLFAQYAHAPNSLGYCGPAESATLAAAATGSPPVAAAPSVASVARRFSGAWPYQRLLAALAGVEDPLALEVVRGYWTGNSLSAAVDRREFGERLLAELAPQAGHYWAHLTPDLLPEAAPSHAFHVLAVYPWSRLLDAGPEPLRVLESCRIGWGQVTGVFEDELVVVGPRLKYDAAGLALGVAEERRVNYRLNSLGFVPDWRVGDIAALHWDFACDRLTPEEADALIASTEFQLVAMRGRVGGLSSGGCGG